MGKLKTIQLGSNGACLKSESVQNEIAHQVIMILKMNIKGDYFQNCDFLNHHVKKEKQDHHDYHDIDDYYWHQANYHHDFYDNQYHA